MDIFLNQLIQFYSNNATHLRHLTIHTVRRSWPTKWRSCCHRRYVTSFHPMYCYFCFSIRTSPQCRNILVCENTKTESMYFHGKFPSKCVDRPCRVWRSYSSHLVWSTPSHSASQRGGSLCRSVAFRTNLKTVIQTVSHIFCCLVQPQNRLGPPSEPRYRFRFLPKIAVSVLKPTQPEPRLEKSQPWL